MNDKYFKILMYLPPSILTILVIIEDGLNIHSITVFFVFTFSWILIAGGIGMIIEKSYISYNYKKLQKIKSEKTKINDSDFGKIKPSMVGSSFRWIVSKRFLGVDMKIHLKGNKKGIYKKDKEKLLNILNNESIIKIKAEEALDYELKKHTKVFTSISKHLEMNNVKLIIIYDLLGEDFYLSYPERKAGLHSYNVIFRNQDVYTVEYN